MQTREFEGIDNCTSILRRHEPQTTNVRSEEYTHNKTQGKPTREEIEMHTDDPTTFRHRWRFENCNLYIQQCYYKRRAGIARPEQR